MEREIEHARALGLCGVKYHPDFQTFNIDDPKMIPVYRRLMEYGMPVLFHMGDERYDYSAPRRLYNVMQQLPELTCIAAHFGGYQRWSEAASCLLEGNIWFDTSSTLWKLEPDRARGLIHHYGADRMLFGTDFPMWDPAEEIDRFLALGLTDEENDRILYQNFERLFGVTL